MYCTLIIVLNKVNIPVSYTHLASSVESPKREYVNPSVDVGLPDIQFITLETAPADCVVPVSYTHLVGTHKDYDKIDCSTM